MIPIRVVRLAELRRADDMRGDIVAAVHHVQMQVAALTEQKAENRG